MASYSYKELCYQIPEHINKSFVDVFKREPDGNPGYDGDYWTLAAMYVEDLIKQRDELLEALESLLRSSVMSVSHSEYVAVFDEANAVLTKVKGGAA